MQWESITAPDGNEVYHLVKDGIKMLTLTIHPFSNTARVECDKEKRVFLIRKEGFRRNKTVLRNEYGIKIGELGHENNLDFIDVNQERFFYSIEKDPTGKMVLYKESKEKPFASCMMTTADGSTKQLGSTTHPGLLMALCWYMFLPLTKEQTIPV